MGLNREKPHILVLPEDDANRQIAAAFLQSLDPLRQCGLLILPIARGWAKTLSLMESTYAGEMIRYPESLLVLLIDFDGQVEERLALARGRIPETLADRVFVLGAADEPETLRSAGLGSFETIGHALADDCRDNTTHTWGHDELRHNAGELGRLRDRVSPILFQ